MYHGRLTPGIICVAHCVPYILEGEDFNEALLGTRYWLRRKVAKINASMSVGISIRSGTNTKIQDIPTSRPETTLSFVPLNLHKKLKTINKTLEKERRRNE
jgi:hypothetical protein